MQPAPESEMNATAALTTAQNNNPGGNNITHLTNTAIQDMCSLGNLSESYLNLYRTSPFGQ